MPFGMAATMTRLQKRAEAYSTLYSERRQIRDLYMLLLLMMTSLALFASSWLALHLSKQVTKPVEALADAMASIASGNYSRRVEETATEELGELETMLETIPNGVATIDADGTILLTNRALSEMLDPGGQQPFLGRTLAE